MKTATVTWIKHKNYGTYLQCYALQQYLHGVGYDNVIISDLSCRVNPSRPASTPSAPNPLFLRILRLALHPWRVGISIQVRLQQYKQRKYDRSYAASQSSFDSFRKNKLSVLYLDSPDHIHTLEEVYDAFICGSDQIWSMIFPIQPYYFLDFVRAKKKIAYAPSLGTTVISRQQEETLKELLADFSALSVREAPSAKQLSNLLDRPVAWVADPTLLHDSSFWRDFSGGVKVPRRKYLLCYFLANKPWYFDYAKKIAKKYHLRIVLIPNRAEYVRSPYIPRFPVGPQEFVSLFHHAEYVLTDSYHGSIFSLIFQKQFLHFQRFDDDASNSENLRVHSLFGYLDLDSIVVKENEDWTKKPPVDFPVIEERLNQLRCRSREYLRNSLS